MKKKSGDTLPWSNGSNKRIDTIIHGGLRTGNPTWDKWITAHMGASTLDLDLVHAAGVKPQPRLGIDIHGLWAALPVHRQDADSLQPETYGDGLARSQFSYIAYSASALKINENPGTAISKDGQKRYCVQGVSVHLRERVTFSLPGKTPHTVTLLVQHPQKSLPDQMPSIHARLREV